MGWSCQEKPDNVKEYFDSMFRKGVEVLDSAIVHLTTYYAAIRLPGGQVTCVVILVQFGKRQDSPHYSQEMCYKSMDEFAGPVDSDCPERILKLLTPLKEVDEPGYSAKWRYRCWKAVALRKRAIKVKNRMAIQFKSPITFVNGLTADTFFRDTKSGVNAFTGLGGCGVYRISGWRMRRYKILE